MERARLLMTLADRRLQEFRALAEAGQVNEAVLQAMQAEISQAEATAGSGRLADQEKSALLSDLVTLKGRQRTVLEQMIPQLPPASQEVVGRVVEALGQPTPTPTAVSLVEPTATSVPPTEVATRPEPSATATRQPELGEPGVRITVVLATPTPAVMATAVSQGTVTPTVESGLAATPTPPVVQPPPAVTVLPTSAPPTPTPTTGSGNNEPPVRGTVVPTPTPPGSGSRSPGISNFRLSGAPDGPAASRLPAGVHTVYAVFDYSGLANEGIRLRVYDGRGNTLFDTTRVYNGSGHEVIAIGGPGGVFPDDSYVTNLYRLIGGSSFLSQSIEWSVGP
jgi:hypothetical protein